MFRAAIGFLGINTQDRRRRATRGDEARMRNSEHEQSVDLESSPLNDFARVDLKDTRRDDRLMDIVNALFCAPAQSFPEAVNGDPARLEGLYRFFNNEQVTAQQLLEPHIQSCFARSEAQGCIYAVHDSTELTFECRQGEHHRKHLRRVSEYTQGLLLHATLAVSADGSAVPLGILGMMTWADTQEDAAKRPPSWKKSQRWIEQSLAVEKRCPVGLEIIDVMDREADFYALLKVMDAHKKRYIVRMLHDRNVVDEQAETIVSALANEPVCGKRKIKLGARAKSRRSPAGNRKHPPRKKRDAYIGVRRARLVVKKPTKRTKKDDPDLSINVVEVVERNPPKGAMPVSWFLLTTEPIETEEECWRVVDGYRARWTIEEYFKCLKTGCAVESRQLKSRKALENMLGVMMPLSWRLLLLRNLAQTPLAQQSAQCLFNQTELTVLALAVPHCRLGKNPMLKEALYAMAALGGHLKQSGPPGWLTLWRGFRKLQDRYAGYLMGIQRSVEG